MFGYLDPATGSMIISAVVAGGAGASVAMRTMMSKFRPAKSKSAAEDIADNDVLPQPTV